MLQVTSHDGLSITFTKMLLRRNSYWRDLRRVPLSMWCRGRLVVTTPFLTILTLICLKMLPKHPNKRYLRKLPAYIYLYLNNHSAFHITAQNVQVILKETGWSPWDQERYDNEVDGSYRLADHFISLALLYPLSVVKVTCKAVLHLMLFFH